VQLSGFERGSNKVAVAPDQPTQARRAEIVERNAELGRQDVQAVQSKAGAMVGDIADATWVDVAIEEHQYVAIDRRTADGASLAVTSRLKRFPKRRHARLPHEENKAAERNMIARRPRHAVSGWGAEISGADTIIALALRRNEIRPLRLMPTLRVNSGTAGGFA
jgi:hypothetical protein